MSMFWRVDISKEDEISSQIAWQVEQIILAGNSVSFAVWKMADATGQLEGEVVKYENHWSLARRKKIFSLLFWVKEHMCQFTLPMSFASVTTSVWQKWIPFFYFNGL